MQIELQQVMPVPLKDRLQQRPSQVWGANIVLKQGEGVKIKAPSGTGKTTLVHIMYGLRQDYEGAVLVGGQNMRQVSKNTLAEIRQQRFSIVFQDLRLFANLTARENIELKRVMQPPVCESAAVDEMAQKLGITHILHQPAALCSYGEQQRIAIIRALVQPFNWLLMDEPFSHLDHNNTAEAAELILEECAKRGAGFILTDLEDDGHFAYSRKFLL
jgi:putative ABC transport system ATP-binding protein